jgi:glycosyltransferase involved in cell wall biosynthesis
MRESLISVAAQGSRPAIKKRVLFLRRLTSFGGSDIVVLDLLKAINYETTFVLLASTRDGFSRACSDLRLPVTCLDLTAPFSGGYVRMFVAWMRYLGRLRPDKIILAEGGFREFPLPAALAAFAIARGNVWMMELHPAEALAKPKFRLIPLPARERVRAWLPRGVLSVSHGVKDRLVRVYGYAPGKVSVIYNGVDTRRFSPPSQGTRRALRRELQIPDEAVVLVSTARLDRIKRLDRLIRAFGALSLKRDRLWLLFTGDGPLRDELKSLAQSVKDAENIKFLGHVQDVRPILWASDIYVLPSDEEGFGIALAEAMSCKLICVATETIGPAEILEDGMSGFLTEATDEGVLKGIERALRLNGDERMAMGNRARQRVLKNFRVEESAAKGLAFMNIDSDMKIVR